MEKWSVCVAERPLALGALDNMAFHKDTSHSFLRVKDGTGRVRMEIHGMAFDSKSGKWEASPTSLRSIFSAAAFAAIDYQSPFAPRLRVVAIEDPDKMCKPLPGRNVIEHPAIFSGAQKTVMACVESALRAAVLINRADIPYYAADLKGNGQNCHSVTAELIDRMMGRRVSPPAMSYATPGIGQDLEKIIPALSAVTPQRETPYSAIKESISYALAQLQKNRNPPTHPSRAGLQEKAAGLRSLSATP